MAIHLLCRSCLWSLEHPPTSSDFKVSLSGCKKWFPKWLKYITWKYNLRPEVIAFLFSLSLWRSENTIRLIRWVPSKFNNSIADACRYRHSIRVSGEEDAAIFFPFFSSRPLDVNDDRITHAFIFQHGFRSDRAFLRNVQPPFMAPPQGLSTPWALKVNN